MPKLRFGIVDQSPIRQGGTVQQALQETVRLAQIAEEIGYHRYWVAEHHNSGGFAGTAPEILIGQIASQTKRITVGSGGVMLSHYSSLKVAETFRVLQSFYPERIELGIGRAPGSLSAGRKNQRQGRQAVGRPDRGFGLYQDAAT